MRKVCQYRHNATYFHSYTLVSPNIHFTIYNQYPTNTAYKDINFKILSNSILYNINSIFKALGVASTKFSIKKFLQDIFKKITIRIVLLDSVFHLLGTLVHKILWKFTLILGID